MAGIDVQGTGGKRRSLDSEINMIPMIDLLMVTISFLLVTAVWVQSARLESNANVPGPSDTPPCEGDACKEEPRLHVMAGHPDKFVLAWRQGRAVVRSIDVPREAARPSAAGGGVSFPRLSEAVATEWKAAGVHREATDRRFDRAVIHASNDMPYAELVAVMDAVGSPKRKVSALGADSRVAAFQMTFATD
jgi:biopolymer transport protein ExbD